MKKPVNSERHNDAELSVTPGTDKLTGITVTDAPAPLEPPPKSDATNRASSELLQPQYTERSPLFTRPSSPHSTFSATTAGPSRAYDGFGYRQPSPTDIVLQDNRTQPHPQHKPGFWARITGAATRDKLSTHKNKNKSPDSDSDSELESDLESEPVRTRGRRLPPQPTLPNILFFGSRSSGKSSLINMLAGKHLSRVSDDGLAAFASRRYVTDIGGRDLMLWDIVGLQAEHDALSENAAINLHRLIQNLHGGINLLVHCVNSTHPNQATQIKIDHEAFYRIIGNTKVPVVLVVTALENQDPMEEWWTVNEGEIKRRGMTYDGHACVAAIRGEPLKDGYRHRFDEQYEQSRLAVGELITAKLGGAVVVREEGKLAEFKELLSVQDPDASKQNGDKGKKSLGRTWGSGEMNGEYGSSQDEQWDNDAGDRIKREGRTASLALLGGLVAVFVVLQSGIMECF